jgi:hypothetical protein
MSVAQVGHSNAARPLAVGLLALLLLPLVSAGLGVPLVSEGPWGAWRSQTVAERFKDVSVGLALDSSDAPHIPYMRSDDLSLWLASDDGIQWEHERLFELAGIPSLEIDAEDALHLTYRSNSLYGPVEERANLVYAYSDGTGWVREIVEADGNVGSWNELRLDQSGHPHVIYQSNGILSYAFRDSAGVWTIERLPTEANALWSGLGIGPDGAAHVAYEMSWNSPWGRLMYALRDPTSGTWSIEEVDERGGPHVALAVDSQGRPHVSYADEGEVLTHAMRDADGWHLTIVDRDAPTARDTSIAIDSQDRPHISYYQVFNRGWNDDPTRGHLRYATQTSDGRWVVEFADMQGWHGESIIRIDSQDRPHIAFKHIADQMVDLGNGFTLRYAEPVLATRAPTLLEILGTLP